MDKNLERSFAELRIEAPKWRFIDMRIDIPAGSFGSDAINPHTQYSNPVALAEFGSRSAIGSSFTLGAGNEMVCKAAEYIVSSLDGYSVADLIASKDGFYETLTNPLQLRWISPNAGLPLMAAGLVVNTLLDAASKSAGLPAWEYLARLPSDFLMELISFRHLDNRFSKEDVRKILDRGLPGIDERCLQLKEKGIPVYYTTWIGHDAETIAKQILIQNKDRGITIFKVKIGPNFEHDSTKLLRIQELAPSGIQLCVDANQTLTLAQAKLWLNFLTEHRFKWLEEPFAPDNVSLFKSLIEFKHANNLSCEVVTGENCPNYYTASSLMESGIDRFQSDPCRMLGLIDSVSVCIVAAMQKCIITPHAGGSSLDELSPHIQLFNLARIRNDLDPFKSLTENVGFCSRYFKVPTVVKRGCAITPIHPGLLVGVPDFVISHMIDYKEGTSWLEL